MEKEWNSSRDAAWQNLMDASMNRDAVALGAALSECETFGVEKQAIHEGEKLLKTVEREDQLLKEIADLIDQRDASKLPEAITVFRFAFIFCNRYLRLCFFSYCTEQRSSKSM